MEKIKRNVGDRVKYAGMNGQILMKSWKKRIYRIELEQQGNGEKPVVISASFSSKYIKDLEVD